MVSFPVKTTSIASVGIFHLRLPLLRHGKSARRSRTMALREATPASIMAEFWCSRSDSLTAVKRETRAVYLFVAAANVCCPRNGKTGVAHANRATGFLHSPLCRFRFQAWEGEAIGPVSPDTGQNGWKRATGVCRELRSTAHCIPNPSSARPPPFARAVVACRIRASAVFVLHSLTVLPVSFDHSARGCAPYKNRLPPYTTHQDMAVIKGKLT